MIRKYIHQGSKTALTITLSWLIFISSIEREKKTQGMLSTYPRSRHKITKKDIYDLFGNTKY